MNQFKPTNYDQEIDIQPVIKDHSKNDKLKKIIRSKAYCSLFI